GHVDLERAPAEIAAVELQSLLGRLLLGKRDEREAFRLSGLAVADHRQFFNRAVLREKIAQLRFVDTVRKVADIEFVLLHYISRCSSHHASWSGQFTPVAGQTGIYLPRRQGFRHP